MKANKNELNWTELNSAFFVRRNEWNIEEKQKSPKNSACDGIGQITFQIVRKYVFFSLRYSMARFTVLFVFKRSSNNVLCGARETDVRAARPIQSNLK